MKTRLQELRKKAGFQSAVAFAEHYGINAGTYTNYEQGKRNLTLEKAWEFADLLNCSLDELAGRQWPPKGASRTDPTREEIIACYDGSNAENRGFLLQAARRAALASGEDAKRDDVQGEEVSA